MTHRQSPLLRRGPWGWLAALLATACACTSTAPPPNQQGYIPFTGAAPPCVDHDSKDGTTAADAGSAADTSPADAGFAGDSSPDVAILPVDTSAGGEDIAAPPKDVLDGSGGASDIAATTDTTAQPDSQATDADAAAVDAATLDTTQPDAAADAPAGPPTFGVVWDKVISKYGCTSAVCHGNQSGDMAYFVSKGTTWEKIVNKASKVKDCQFLPIVFPGKPETSVLYTKLKQGAKTCGDKMPIGSEGLPDSLTNTVKEWIEAGAPK